MSSHPRRHSNEELLQSLVDLYEEEGEISMELYARKGDYSPNTIYMRFGSWNQGLEEAGLSTAGHDEQYGDEELLQSLRGLYEDVGEINMDIYEDKGEYSVSTIQRRFGSWNSALEEAGLPLNTPDRYYHGISDTDILESVDKIKNMYDLDSMSMSSYKIFRDKYLNDKNMALPSVKTIRSRFGSYHEMLRICGLKGGAQRPALRYTDVSEDDVVEWTADHLNNIFLGEVTKEFGLKNDVGQYFARPDLAVEDNLMVIECKDSITHNIRAGVGQTIYYNTTKYRAYLSLYDECVRDKDVEICNDVGIGLIGVTSDDLNVYVDNDINI